MRFAEAKGLRPRLPWGVSGMHSPRALEPLLSVDFDRGTGTTHISFNLNDKRREIENRHNFSRGEIEISLTSS